MSHSSSSNNQPYHSSIPDLVYPEGGFSSVIPPHLLENCDEQTKWLLQEVSKNTQATEFACKAVVAQNAHLKALNGKTFKNQKDAALLGEKVEALEGQAKAVAPFFKPVSQFAALWEYRAFRWTFYAAIFFFFTYLLPYYLQHPFSISQFFKFLFPGS